MTKSSLKAREVEALALLFVPTAKASPAKGDGWWRQTSLRPVSKITAMAILGIFALLVVYLLPL
jgi:hypothetical protein